MAPGPQESTAGVPDMTSCPPQTPFWRLRLADSPQLQDPARGVPAVGRHVHERYPVKGEGVALLEPFVAS